MRDGYQCTCAVVHEISPKTFLGSKHKPKLNLPSVEIVHVVVGNIVQRGNNTRGNSTHGYW